MTIPVKIIDYLEKKNVDFAITAHPYSETSMEAAHAARVSSECLAKAVLLGNADKDDYVLAVLPASHEVKIPMIEKHLGRPVTLAPEKDLADAFDDCTPGAVPALGNAYGIRTVVDTALATLPEIYFEAGDHRDLIHVSGPDFGALMADSEFATISEHR